MRKRDDVRAAVDKAIIAAKLAYQFSPGSYTASALSEICAVRELLSRPHQDEALETDQERLPEGCQG